jgi:hypothetical protein
VINSNLNLTRREEKCYTNVELQLYGKCFRSIQLEEFIRRTARIAIAYSPVSIFYTLFSDPFTEREK